ncbi:MAG: glycosyl hydrolase family 32 [bacterium]|nr:glycosyl hydrolase family 32 [bacterium]
MSFLNAVVCVLVVVLGFTALPAAAGEEDAGEVLCNGIRLPAEWPPRGRDVSYEPVTVPYLEVPPEVISIDVGRQLFVDDFLIESTDLDRVCHPATYHEASPVLTPDKPWETKRISQGHSAPTAMVFSDGVWFDPQDGLFKMWYMGGYVGSTCYATSKDGIHWEKPDLDLVPGTNTVHVPDRDSSTIWLDHFETDANKRYKMAVFLKKAPTGRLSFYTSPDGIRWSDSIGTSDPCGDRSTVFYNPFRRVWVYGIREYQGGGIGRYRDYWEGRDFLYGAKWPGDKAVFWVGADKLDAPREDMETPCELYNLDGVAYESLILGMFDIWRGQPDDRAKPNQLCVGFSRDGFHWSRPTHDAFLGVSERFGDWNWANVQSAGGCCLVVGEKLYFYVSGRKGVEGSKSSGVCTTGLATLRRDGFVSMDAGEQAGTLTTRPVTFSGSRLFVNADVDTGELRVEVLDRDGAPVAPFTADRCSPIASDGTLTRVQWEGDPSLEPLAGTPVRFRFTLRRGRLYAFWVSDDSGASHGYVAAGGPRFAGPTDTVGAASYGR